MNPLLLTPLYPSSLIQINTVTANDKLMLEMVNEIKDPDLQKNYIEKSLHQNPKQPHKPIKLYNMAELHKRLQDLQRELNETKKCL